MFNTHNRCRDSAPVIDEALIISSLSHLSVQGIPVSMFTVTGTIFGYQVRFFLLMLLILLYGFIGYKPVLPVFFSLNPHS